MNYALLSSQHGALNGHRRTTLKLIKSGTASSSNSTDSNATASLAPLADLLASSCGNLVVATVSSGARYKGVLVTADISGTGNSAMLIVLDHPKLALKSLLNEKSNVDDDLPERLVIQAKDLIDVEVATAVASNKDAKEVKKNSPGPAPLKADSPSISTSPSSSADSFTSTSSKIPSPATVPKNTQVPASKTISYSELAKRVNTDSSSSSSKTVKAPISTSAAVTTSVVPKIEKKLAAVSLQDTKTNTQDSAKFRTDRDISAGFKFKERELQKWQPDEDTKELTLEDNQFNSGSWDQFKVNEEKFGVESTYDEHLYTTRVNTSATDYNERLQRAQKIAREIEGLTTQDHHVMEERGIVVADDSGMDEEDKYSGVLADVQPAKVDTRGSELMAALRLGSLSNEGSGDVKRSLPGDGKYSTPGQRAAQYHDDPAIVASSATKKTPVVAASTTGLTAAVASVAETSKKDSQKKPASAPQETFRLNAQSEINSLKEFSASFKVPHKMPNDLLPILAKDKSKQDQILKKQEQSKEAKEAAGKEVPSKTTAKPEAQSSRKSSTTDGVKEVKQFKLNPKAAAFTPSRPLQASPSMSMASTVTSPRMQNQKPGSFGGRDKKPHTLTAVEVFGSQDKVPTAESKKKKLNRLREGVNMYASILREQEARKDSSTPITFPKMFTTPPTWDSTVDESYEKVITGQCISQSPAPGHPGVPYMGNPMMGGPGSGPHMAAPGGYNGVAAAGGKFPVSPSMHHSMAQIQQQQMQAAMFYQQFQAGAGGRPGPHMMYMPPGSDPQYMAPGFIVPGGMMGGTYGHMSPTYTGSDMGYSGGSQGLESHHNGGQGGHSHEGRGGSHGGHNNHGSHGSQSSSTHAGHKEHSGYNSNQGNKRYQKKGGYN